MPIVDYDCGDLSEVILSTSASVGHVVTVTSNNLTGNVRIPNTSPVEFLCTGPLSINYSSGATFYAAVVDVSQGVWTDNFLMGLAGLICGALIAFVLSKYAV